MNLAGAAAKWLSEQPKPNLRIAREIIARRKALESLVLDSEQSDLGRSHKLGTIAGLRLGLSYLSDRPGDISDTGAEGFIRHVEHADELRAEKTETVLTASHAGKDIDPTRNYPEEGR